MDPKVIKFLKKNSPMDMDQLIKIVKVKEKIGVYLFQKKIGTMLVSGRNITN